MACVCTLAESSGRHQPGEIKGNTARKSRGRLREFLSCASGARGLFCGECQFSEHAELAAASRQSCVGGDYRCDARSPKSKVQSPKSGRNEETNSGESCAGLVV